MGIYIYIYAAMLCYADRVIKVASSVRIKITTLGIVMVANHSVANQYEYKVTIKKL